MNYNSNIMQRQLDLQPSLNVKFQLLSVKMHKNIQKRPEYTNIRKEYAKVPNEYMHKIDEYSGELWMNIPWEETKRFRIADKISEYEQNIDRFSPV